MNKKNWLKDFVSVHKGNIIEILAKKTSSGKPREVARRSPGVRVIAITKDNKFIISHEQREYLEHESDHRLPGGKVVDTLAEYHALLERGALEEAILEAAKRELLEETGIRAQSWKLFKVSNSGGTIDWDLHYFIAKDLSFGEARPEDDEKIEVLRYPLLDVIDLALSKNYMSEDRSRLALLDYLIENQTLEVAQRVRNLD